MNGLHPFRDVSCLFVLLIHMRCTMWVLQTLLSAACICMGMDIIEMSSTATKSPTKEARYPNPLKQHSMCYRRRPSFICDPDNLLSWNDAERLDFLLNNIRNTTPCLCPACPMESPSGISIGIFLRENFTDEERSTKGFSSKELAKTLREEWKLGKCDDDIVIVVIAEEKRSAVSLGTTVLNVLPYQAAEEIAKRCDGHFKTNYIYFPQGLSAMVYSFHDELQQPPRSDTKSARRKNIGIIIGITLGVIVINILIVSGIILLWRQLQKKNSSKSRSGTVRWQKPQGSEPYEYKLCHMENSAMNRNEDGGSSDSDEENQSNSSTSDTDVDPQMQGMYRKRELSDVPEEAEDIVPGAEEGDTEVFNTSQQNNRSLEVTEL